MAALVGSFNAAVDPSTNIDNWYSLVWNVLTAQGYGLDVWGRIVWLPNGRVVALPTGQTYFGFTQSTSPTLTASGLPFNQAPFYNGTGATNNFQLSDEVFRQIILAKALANISNGSIAAINNVLMIAFPAATFAGYITGSTLTVTELYTGTIAAAAIIAGGTTAANSGIWAQLTGVPGGAGTYAVTPSQTTSLSNMTSNGKAYCTDLGGMTMTYTFSWAISSVQNAILYQSNIFPRPCGVSTSVVHP